MIFKYSLDCREGDMKKMKMRLLVILFACKVKKHMNGLIPFSERKGYTPFNSVAKNA